MPTEALELAVEIELGLATARGSSRAVWVRARAESELGRWAAAGEAAEAYLGLVSASDLTAGPARLLSLEARFQTGSAGAFEALWALTPNSPEEIRAGALELARTWIARLDDPALRDLVAEAPTHPWLTPVALTEIAMRRFLVGDASGAETAARQALTGTPDSVERETLARILDGSLERPGLQVQGVLGAIFSASGPPSFQTLSREIQEGVELALLDERVRGGVRLEVADDAGTAGRAGGAWAQLEGARPFALLGPLTEATVAEVARRRSAAVPILSPTARILPVGESRVYSLAGPDPEAMQVLARVVLSQGVREVIVLHAADPEEDLEAAWFQDAFVAGGGQIARVVSVAVGSLNLDGPLESIGRARPRGLVVLAPPEDVERIAPLLAFHGMDPSAAQGSTRVFGNASWSSNAILETVPPRFLEGVMSVSPYLAQGYGPLWSEFEALYEAQFQRTLRSPFPALGWDAARILIEAAALAGSTPDDVSRGLDRIASFPGATGTFTVRDGRITRQHFPVRIESGNRIPISDPNR